MPAAAKAKFWLGLNEAPLPPTIPQMGSYSANPVQSTARPAAIGGMPVASETIDPSYITFPLKLKMIGFALMEIASRI